MTVNGLKSAHGSTETSKFMVRPCCFSQFCGIGVRHFSYNFPCKMALATCPCPLRLRRLAQSAFPSLRSSSSTSWFSSSSSTSTSSFHDIIIIINNIIIVIVITIIIMNLTIIIIIITTTNIAVSFCSPTLFGISFRDNFALVQVKVITISAGHRQFLNEIRCFHVTNVWCSSVQFCAQMGPMCMHIRVNVQILLEKKNVHSFCAF